MSLSVTGVWEAGTWATTVWADGVWREGAYTNDPAGKLVSIFLGSTPVPNTADYRAGTAYSDAGELYVCNVPADPNDVNYIRGVAHRDDGAICITTTGPVKQSVGGWGLNSAGVVVVSTDTPEYFTNAIPRLDTGEVCMTDVN